MAYTISVVDIRSDEEDGIASIRLTSGGDILEITSTLGFIDIGDWKSPKSIPSSNYEARVSSVIGVTPTGPAVGSWHVLSTTREWSITRLFSSFTLEIREAGGQVLASASVELIIEPNRG